MSLSGWRNRFMHRHWSVALGLACVLTMALSACGNSTSSAAPSQSQAKSNKTAATGTTNHLGLITPGYLTVGSDTTYPPMETRDPTTQKYVGADIDLANALAKAMGLKGAIIKSAVFDSLIPSLQAHRFDVVMSSMNDTPERAKKVDFVDYMTATMGIVVKKGSSIKANNYGALCGKTVAVERGTVEQDDLNAANKSCSSKINILVSGADTDAFQAFNSGHSEAYTTDLPVAVYYTKKFPTKFQLAGKPISAHARYGIALNKGKGALKTALQDAVAKIRGNGQYTAILKKWGVGGAALPK
jgi:polar amino acid transport system substrate-binding protein